MTQEEKIKLREHFEFYINDWAKKYPTPIVNDHSLLDEDSSQFHTSTAELEVFHLNPEHLHRLHTAFTFYEIFIDIASGHGFDEGIVTLIEKARSICPPIHFFGKEFEFQTRCDEQQWFSWFAKEFFDLSMRSSHAFWHKKSFNLSHLTKFKDEIKLDNFSKERVKELIGEAPIIAPELIDELYEALNKGGVQAVNALFKTKGTFDPNFKDKKAVIDYIVLMKRFSGIELTPEEEAVDGLNRNKN